MLLKILAKSKGPWKVAAAAERGADGSIVCEFESELLGFAEQHGSAIEGLYQFWTAIPKVGPKGLGTAMYHYVDEEEQIYEFVKGRLRVLCFVADGALCVCCTVFLKDTRKTPRAFVNRAVKMKRRFEEASKAGAILMHDEDDDEEEE